MERRALRLLAHLSQALFLLLVLLSPLEQSVNRAGQAPRQAVDFGAERNAFLRVQNPLHLPDDMRTVLDKLLPQDLKLRLLRDLPASVRILVFY